jgi:hypothetical protein
MHSRKKRLVFGGHVRRTLHVTKPAFCSSAFASATLLLWDHPHNMNAGSREIDSMEGYLAKKDPLENHQTAATSVLRRQLVPRVRCSVNATYLAKGEPVEVLMSDQAEVW